MTLSCACGLVGNSIPHTSGGLPRLRRMVESCPQCSVTCKLPNRTASASVGREWRLGRGRAGRRLHGNVPHREYQLFKRHVEEREISALSPSSVCSPATRLVWLKLPTNASVRLATPSREAFRRAAYGDGEMPDDPRGGVRAGNGLMPELLRREIVAHHVDHLPAHAIPDASNSVAVTGMSFQVGM